MAVFSFSTSLSPAPHPHLSLPDVLSSSQYLCFSAPLHSISSVSLYQAVLLPIPPFSFLPFLCVCHPSPLCTCPCQHPSVILPLLFLLFFSLFLCAAAHHCSFLLHPFVAPRPGVPQGSLLPPGEQSSLLRLGWRQCAVAPCPRARCCHPVSKVPYCRSGGAGALRAGWSRALCVRRCNKERLPAC